MTVQSPGRVLVIGEALMDIAVTDGDEITESPGGSPANVALALGRLGTPVQMRTALGSDERGDRLRAWLTESGVSLEVTDLPSTSTALAHLDANGAARYEFQINWTLDDAPLVQSEAVHFGSIGAWYPPGTWRVEALVERARPASTISFDPNIRPHLIRNPETTRARVERLAHLADIIKLSDEDLQWLRPGQSADLAVRDWLNAGASVVIITRGGEGSLTFTNSLTLAQRATTTAIVDTIGAGDTFMGTLLSTLHDGGYLGADRRDALAAIDRDEWLGVLQRSGDAAAITVSRAGANPPWRGELKSSASYISSTRPE